MYNTNYMSIPLIRNEIKTCINKEKLIILHFSTMICYYSSFLSSLRRCNASSEGVDGCGVMCCGRGFTSHTRRTHHRCHCKYHWCCYVTCQTCAVWHDVHTCNWPHWPLLWPHLALLWPQSLPIWPRLAALPSTCPLPFTILIQYYLSAAGTPHSLTSWLVKQKYASFFKYLLNALYYTVQIKISI